MGTKEALRSEALTAAISCLGTYSTQPKRKKTRSPKSDAMDRRKKFKPPPEAKPKIRDQHAQKKKKRSEIYRSLSCAKGDNYVGRGGQVEMSIFLQF
jgi:hypothetical protein